MNSFDDPDRSVVGQVDRLLNEAIALHASDIHLEPTEKELRVRWRLDGILYDQRPLDRVIMDQVISRLKVLAHMNIAEKRIPQDGMFCNQVANQRIDFRVSTFPCLYGEKIVIRILNRQAQAIALEQLGFAPDMLAQFKMLISRPQGFFLVTGPTGSGKTTTLYAALAALNCTQKNIASLEDPVEYHLDGITQGHINPDAGFTFEKGIRALLRQDPDILMVGEIRDKQTAHVAIQAALTGHLVLSTLHTNDAASAIMRLMDMGIEPFLINAALSGVLAQRLVRKLCTACKSSYTPTRDDIAILSRLELNASELFKAAGCDACNQLGYKGRMGIFELLQPSSALRSLIVKQPRFDAISLQARQDGMISLMQDGGQKLKNGMISLSELARVIH